MSVTIRLSDDLAAQLRTRAALERMSVEEFAVQVLSDAARHSLDPEDWAKHNRRRLALIRKRFSEGLIPEEEQELQQLQEIADRQVEDSDRAMLEDIDRLEARVNGRAGGR